MCQKLNAVHDIAQLFLKQSDNPLDKQYFVRLNNVLLLQSSSKMNWKVSNDTVEIWKRLFSRISPETWFHVHCVLHMLLFGCVGDKLAAETRDLGRVCVQSLSGGTRLPFQLYTTQGKVYAGRGEDCKLVYHRLSFSFPLPTQTHARALTSHVYACRFATNCPWWNIILHMYAFTIPHTVYHTMQNICIRYTYVCKYATRYTTIQYALCIKVYQSHQNA